jgi:hypothetical protein
LVIFALLDPDPLTRLNPDPDAQPCLLRLEKDGAAQALLGTLHLPQLQQQRRTVRGGGGRHNMYESSAANICAVPPVTASKKPNLQYQVSY